MKAVSVIIVNFNSTDFLEPCLESLERETSLPHQVTVVDNASDDQDFSRLRSRYPATRFLLNDRNRGFAAACNQGIQGSEAEFYLLLNPDTEILEGAIDKTAAFLEAHPPVGIAGCRVENPDGSLQRAARRSIPRPSTAFYQFSGLARIFPASPRFGRYNLTYLNESENCEVEAVSGSFLMFRRALIESIGLLDETFFLYGEDLDFCYRSLLAGWKVYYFAGAKVLHHKGRSSSRRPSASTFHFYDAMKIFYRKHFASTSSRLKNRCVLSAIDGFYFLQLVRQWLTGEKRVGPQG